MFRQVIIDEDVLFSFILTEHVSVSSSVHWRILFSTK